jgi:SAM-dependent methyltransferase
MSRYDEKLRATFNKSAQWYDRARPGYPVELIDDVICLSAIPRHGRILEIGCGTGKATEMFAHRGFSMVCLEIGRDLAAVAAQKFHDTNCVQIVERSFEEWEPDDQLFDLVIAATSFHWVDPAIAFSKSAAVLRANGSLAVFSNRHIRQEEGFFHEVQAIYQTYATSMIAAAKTRSDRKEPADKAMFETPTERRYQWAVEYTAADYIDLLGTYSDHISLPDSERQSLFAHIAALIDQKYDGRVHKHYESVLLLYRKRQ